jgi:putative transposase
MFRLRNWVADVNEPLAKQDLELVRTSVNRGRPLGPSEWVQATARRLGLEFTLRNPGRPKSRKAK